jgi:hypothetical protein
MTTRFGAPLRLKRWEGEPAASFFDHDGDVGFSLYEMRFVARRQLTGSIVVACGIAAAVGLAAVRPNHHEALHRSAYRVPVVQQPIFVRTEHHIASAKQDENDGSPASDSS